MFDRLEKPSYPELIAQRIRSLILEGQFNPGDRLPSERVMSDQFGVSRSSIREGIKLLNALGWVEIRVGDGIYISENLQYSVLQSLSWAAILSETVASELLEARATIEPPIAALAARRANDAHKAAIYETVERMERDLGNIEKFLEADWDFHLRIAEAARNQLLYQTLVGLQQIMRSNKQKYLIGMKEQQQALDYHRLIYEAIAHGDADAARELMAASILKDKVTDTEPSSPTPLP